MVTSHLLGVVDNEGDVLWVGGVGEGDGVWVVPFCHDFAGVVVEDSLREVAFGVDYHALFTWGCQNTSC